MQLSLKALEKEHSSMDPNRDPIEKDVHFQILNIHILKFPCKAAHPPGSPPRAPMDRDVPFPEASFICLSRVPGKRTPFPGSPTESL